MELNDLKKTWSSLSEQAKQSELFETEAVQEMMKSGYRSRLNRLLIPELLILVFCFYFAALFFLMFAQLETPLLENLARVSIPVLMSLPVFRIIFLRRFYQMGELQKSYNQSIEEFGRLKVNFHRLQQISIGLGFIFIGIAAVLSTKIYNEYDITQSKYFWTITLLFGLSFLFFFYKWIMKPYNKSIREIELLLNDLD